MARIWEKAISILAGYLNSGFIYLITTVIWNLGSANLCISIQETLRLAESKCNVA